MRKPSEYLPAALAGLRGRLIPDCSETLVYCGRTATVTRVGTTYHGENSLSEAGMDVTEELRVLASASDFPGLDKGALVALSDKWRIVTSARTDPSSAVLSIGLSVGLEKHRASYRRPGTKLRQPVDVLAVEGDVLDPVSDCVAPTTARAWFVAVSCELWLDNTPPQVGDELEMDGNTFRVAAVAHHEGCWLLTCRARR